MEIFAEFPGNGFEIHPEKGGLIIPFIVSLEPNEIESGPSVSVCRLIGFEWQRLYVGVGGCPIGGILGG